MGGQGTLIYLFIFLSFLPSFCRSPFLPCTLRVLQLPLLGFQWFVYSLRSRADFTLSIPAQNVVIQGTGTLPAATRAQMGCLRVC